MKKIFIPLIFLFILSSCVFHHHHPRTGALPPGQAKKITGSKSAKPYAPGQRNKYYRGH
jgi:hypothetical protein